MPTFNGAKHLGETLNSLLAQSVPIHEVIVVDDGSTDDTRSIVASHRLSPRLVLQENRGAAFARNHGAAVATGDYVALLDQDDLWLKNRHDRLLRHFLHHPTSRAVVTTCTGFSLESDVPNLRRLGDLLHRVNAVLPDDADPVESLRRVDDRCPPHLVRKLTMPELLSGPPSVTVSYVIHRLTYLAAGGCVPFARSFDDYLGIINVALASDIDYLDEPSLLYRIHSVSGTMTTDWHLPLLTSAIAVRHGGRAVRPGKARDLQAVPPILDDRHFLLHHLRELAQESNQGFRDALAVAQLLSTSPGEMRRLMITAIRARLSPLKRRALRAWRGQASPQIPFEPAENPVP